MSRVGSVAVSSFVALMLMGAAGSAFAQDPPAAAPPAAEPAAAAPPVAAATGTSAAPSDSKMRLALNVVPMPFLGKLKASAGGTETSADAAFAFGIMPVFDYSVMPNFFVGFSPMYTFNVKDKDGMGDAAKELDLMVRIGGMLPAGDKLNVYGYLSPGYSIVMLPSGTQGIDNPKGLTVGVHAGAAFDVASNIFVNGQIGYQLGLQKTSVAGTDIDFKTNYLQIALGGGIRL